LELPGAHPKTQGAFLAAAPPRSRGFQLIDCSLRLLAIAFDMDQQFAQFHSSVRLTAGEMARTVGSIAD
jgi:hypothetical protein